MDSGAVTETSCHQTLKKYSRCAPPGTDDFPKAKSPCLQEIRSSRDVCSSAGSCDNIHRASDKKAYLYVLKASIISPNTNRILQVGGKRYNDFTKKLERKLSEIHELEKEAALGSPEQEELEKTRERFEEKKKRLKEGLPLEELNTNSSVYLIAADDKTVEAEGEKLITLN